MSSAPNVFYAHSREGRPPEEWQLLEEHLRNVADLAAEFARPFGGEHWAYLAGLWHDLGKFSHAFQKKLYDANGVECHLETKPGAVVHSLAGGHLAQQSMPPGFARIFSWLIMGHHTGLADYSSADSGARALETKMHNPDRSDVVFENVPASVRRQELPPIPPLLSRRADVAFLIRMLFSCVIDADFLDTEAFLDEKRKSLRSMEYPSLDALLRSFDKYMDRLCAKEKETSSVINKLRAKVLEQCRAAAELEPQAFTLTVPTGGGKTLSSLAFALKHAVAWGKRRIIYVIPYTSIIEQTAAVFRGIPGFEGAVIEHHCNVLDESEDKETVRGRLAMENWDAPLIVTTSVQFFESLFACKTSRCRKLHNLAESVVIFDEAQCLPPEYLRPVVFAIRELQRHYGVTPVLCTATQPVLTRTETFDHQFHEGFEAVREIIEKPRDFFIALQRVRVETLNRLAPISLAAVGELLSQEKRSVLCIVNRRRDARLLAETLPEENTLHLSTNMCAAHRLRVLQEIRCRLQNSAEPFFVISTSLVEAGVDLDFPVVYRALAGLDSIAQAAGRCNREGNLEELGKTVVFVPEKQPGYVQSAASLALEFLDPDHIERLFLPETFAKYFTQRFFSLGKDRMDANHVLELLQRKGREGPEAAFRTAAERFQWIDDAWQRHIVVPFGEAQEMVDRLLEYDARSLLRRLQRFIVGIPERELRTLVDAGHVREQPDFPGLFTLDSPSLYHDRFGFISPDDLSGYDVDVLVL